MHSEIVKKNIKFIARELGFGECRIAKISKPPHFDKFQEWLDSDYNGEMEWMEKNPQKRSDPQLVLPGAKSIIILAYNYFQKNTGEQYTIEKKKIDKYNIDTVEIIKKNQESNFKKKYGRIAKYAWGSDYHDIIKWRLLDIDDYLQNEGGVQKCYTDTGPILERDFATKAGVGWNGKSSVQIHRKLGTWFFLSTILTTLDLLPDKKLGDGCGSCTKCIDVCPTNAIISPHVLDARRCVSYLTIESKKAIPLEFRKAIGDRIYGCDECLEICPWNKLAEESQDTELKMRPYVNMSLIDLLHITAEEFTVMFRKSPIKRIKRPAFIRNVCVALGNVGSQEDIPHLEKFTTDENPLIAEHATWAIKEIKQS